MDIYEKRKTASEDDSSSVSFYMQTGRMRGEGNEYVMTGSSVLSKLIWKIDELYMAGGGIEWEPSEGNAFQADLWLKSADGLSTMDDYDWLIEGEDWTHWSNHDDTTVTKAAVFDISYTFTPQRFRNKIFRLKPVAGYRLTDFEWQASGGSYIYTSDPDNLSTFRDTEGDFTEGQLGITYEQIFHTPYAGFIIEVPADFFYVISKFTGSFAVYGKAVDHHHLRDLVTTAYFYWGNMISMDITAGININSDVSVSGNYSYMKYGGLRGDSAYNQSGTVTVYENVEKADFESSMISISVKYNF